MSQSSSGSKGSGSSPSDFVPPTVEDLDAVLDSYQFLDILGRGGMGAVYKARQITLDRLVAIKILPIMDDENDEFRFSERFQREAQAMGRLSHPNIIGVYDFGQTKDGQLYIVMEYVEGTDLHVLIRTGQLTTEHIFGWMPQICEAMQYAHSQGIVHRDIKPANIMINKEGVVKVADFGLAKLTSHDSETTRLTMTNVAMGTPDYVAPEALEDGVATDHRADLYAVGVMLYEMLTGKVPRGAWRPPSILKPEIDPRFDDLVIRAMDADPSSRFQHASEITAEISRIFNTPRGVQVDTPGGRKLNLLANDTGATKRSSGLSPGAKPSGTISGANSEGAASSEIARPPRKPNTGLIVGGSLVAVLVVVGFASFLFLKGGTEKESDDLSRKIAESSSPSISPKPQPAPTLAEPLPETPVKEPSEPRPTPDPPKIAAVPAPVPDVNPEPVTAPIPTPLLPVDQTLYLTSSEARFPVQTLSYQRNDLWTVELWIRPSESDSMTTVASFDEVSLCQNHEPGPAFWHVAGIPINGGRFNADKRVHLAFQHDGKNLEIFLNGEKTASVPSPYQTPGNGDPFTLGGVRGEYDEVRFSSIARYDAPFTPKRLQPDEDTLAFYNFNEEEKAEIAKDLSRNGHDIRLAGVPDWIRRGTQPTNLVNASFDADTILKIQEEWADFYGVPVEYESVIGMKLRLLPAGNYKKGAKSDSDTPIPHPFYIGTFEVTQAEYAEIMGDNPSNFREGGANAEQVAGIDTASHPVEGVNLLQAAEFCNRLSERDGFAPAYRIESESLAAIEGADGYRLPTSVEWEYACRAGTETVFLDGNAELNAPSLERFARVGDRTYPVGEKLPNGFGLRDIQGNVREWANGNDSGDWRSFQPVIRNGGFRRDSGGESWASWKQRDVEWNTAAHDLGFRVLLPGLATVASLPEDREIKRVTPPHPAAEKLTAIESEIRATFSDMVEIPYQAALQRLNDQFRNALTQRVGASQGQEQAFFKTELDRITNGDPMPDSDENLPPAVVQLRKTWRQQHEKLVATRQTTVETFWPTQSQILNQAITEFDKAGLTFFSEKVRDLLTRLQIEFIGEADTNSVAPNPSSLTSTTNQTSFPQSQEGEWIALFDSRTLKDWTATGSTRSFSIDGDAIKASGEPGFLYYTGDAFYDARFRDFDFKAQIKTEGSANSGVFFHTANAGAGYPAKGYEIQIHNGDQDPEKTGSLVGIAKADDVDIPERTWFDLEISVRGNQIIAKVDGKEVLNHLQPADWQPPQEFPQRRVYEGTFALQCHFPESAATWFRDIQVRPYKDALTLELTPEDPKAIQRTLPDLSQLPKGRLNAFGVDAEGKPFTLDGLDRGNDFVDVEISSDFWVALRSRGSPVSPDRYWQGYEKERFAKVSIGSAGEIPILRQDGTLRPHGKPQIIMPGVAPDAFVDTAAGYLKFSGLASDGQISLGGADRYVAVPPPLGPTDIVKIASWHSTLWGLRANGRIVWFGAQITPESEPPKSINEETIVDLVADAAGICLALTDKGKVIAWGDINKAGQLNVPPAAQKDITLIRAGWGGAIAAVRKKDGKWIAWGSDKFGVVSKINSLGPDVVEIAFTESKLIWIE